MEPLDYLERFLYRVDGPGGAAAEISQWWTSEASARAENRRYSTWQSRRNCGTHHPDLQAHDGSRDV